MSEEKKQKKGPKQLDFLSYGRREPRINIVQWEGHGATFQLSDPLVRDKNGYPARIDLDEKLINRIFVDLVEKGYLKL